MYRLLIIEDDKGIAEAIKTQAEMWGMQVHMITNFRNVMAQFAEVEPHIVHWTLRCLFSMVIIGAAKSGRYRRCRSYSFPLHQTI